MLDFLFALGQFFCVIGLIYGLLLAVVHAECVDAMRSSYDPIAGHEWSATRMPDMPAGVTSEYGDHALNSDQKVLSELGVGHS